MENPTIKRSELLNKIASPARNDYDIISDMVEANETTTDLYNDIENTINELRRTLNNLYAVATIEHDIIN